MADGTCFCDLIGFVILSYGVLKSNMYTCVSRIHFWPSAFAMLDSDCICSCIIDLCDCWLHCLCCIRIIAAMLWGPHPTQGGTRKSGKEVYLSRSLPAPVKLKGHSLLPPPPTTAVQPLIKGWNYLGCDKNILERLRQRWCSKVTRARRHFVADWSFLF